MEEGLGERDALLEALREVADHAPGHRREVEAFDGALDGLLEPGSRQAASPTGEAQEAPHAQVGVETRRLGRESDAGVDVPGVRRGGEPVDPHAARAGQQVAGDETDEGGLAGAVGTEQAEGLAGGDVEIDSVHGPLVAEAARQAARLHGNASRGRLGSGAMGIGLGRRHALCDASRRVGFRPLACPRSGPSLQCRP